LPAFIIKRLPVRFTYDNNYFNDKYQGIPIGGYTKLFERMLEGIDVELGVDYLRQKDYFDGIAKRIVFSGAIDEYYDYELGHLQYRSLFFDTEVLNVNNYQGVTVVNYTDAVTPYTRCIEHKHFEFGSNNITNNATYEKTVITHEYPQSWQPGVERYYPINDEENGLLYLKYAELAKDEERVIFGGRLGTYRYLDMDQVIAEALKLAATEFK
jgi:UDP-galactopyranose mutase